MKITKNDISELKTRDIGDSVFAIGWDDCEDRKIVTPAIVDTVILKFHKNGSISLSYVVEASYGYEETSQVFDTEVEANTVLSAGR